MHENLAHLDILVESGREKLGKQEREWRNF